MQFQLLPLKQAKRSALCNRNMPSAVCVCVCVCVCVYAWVGDITTPTIYTNSRSPSVPNCRVNNHFIQWISQPASILSVVCLPMHHTRYIYHCSPAHFVHTAVDGGQHIVQCAHAGQVKLPAVSFKCVITVVMETLKMAGD